MSDPQKLGSGSSRRRSGSSGPRSSGRSRSRSGSHSEQRSDTEAHTAASSGKKRKSRSSSSKASAYYKCKRVGTLLKAIIVLLLIVLVSLAFVSRVAIKKAETDAVNIQYKMDKLKERHATEDKEFLRIEKQMKTLVQGKVPDLNPLVLDKVITVGEKYIQSMLLTVAGAENKKTYEYSLNLHNKFTSVVQPSVMIYLFDRTGLQIGTADLSHIKDDILVPSEKRSYHGKFDIRMKDREPAYFIAEAKWSGGLK